MTETALSRLQEHLDRCHAALSNVGADGVNQLQMHLRLAVEWGSTLGCEANRNDRSLSEIEKRAIASLSKAVIALNNTTVSNLPAAIAKARNQAKSITG